MIAAAMARAAAMGHACAQSFCEGRALLRVVCVAGRQHGSRTAIARTCGDPPRPQRGVRLALCVKVKLYPKPAMQIERNRLSTLDTGTALRHVHSRDRC